ncbi:DASH complex subunit dam1 [Stygiomarasmius scandens]|uniref:DASH complex subunit DAM1 n=1 Tax=Marasmiellus scandens TaxID=2682957 RepID=A0ABR1JUA3_9AGAR
MTEFLDETETLHNNVEGMRQLSDSLATFNESFASFLHVMTMNALTTDWPRQPSEGSFYLAKRRAEEDAMAALEALRAREAAAARAKMAPSASEPSNLNDQTAITETTFAPDAAAQSKTGESSTTGAKPTVKKVVKGKKPKMTAKEKRERGLELEKVICNLPLEFRGSDPTLRKHIESVIEGIWDAPNKTVKLPELIKPPDLNQARVNKCLIALVNKKFVVKGNTTGTVLYRWNG